MSGGVAFVLDEFEELEQQCNKDGGAVARD